MPDLGHGRRNGHEVHIFIYVRKEQVMKKLYVQLFVIAGFVAMTVLPVLAGGGGGP
jgi:hypothetical protein